MICSYTCSTATPHWSAGACNIETREGGIPYLIFFACNFKFNASVMSENGLITIGAITDYTSWEEGVHNRLISRTPEGLGEKPLGSFTTQRLSSCSPEAIASETQNLSFVSYDTDSTSFTDRTYWNNIRTNYGKFRLAWQDCNGYVHYSGNVADPGFVFVPTALGYVIPQTNDENSFYQADLSFKYSGLPTIINVANINDAFVTNIVNS